MPAPAEKGVELLPKTTIIQSRHYRFNSIRMRPFYFLLTTMLTLLSFPLAQAQTAEGGCTSVKLVSGVPLYPNNAYIDPFLVGCSYCNECNKMLNPVYLQSPRTPQFSLQRPVGESWVTVAGWQLSPQFNDLPHGWYRIAVRAPRYIVAPNCTTGWIKIYNTFNQHVGFEGEWAPTIYSNMVTVGETVQSDVKWTFIDPNSNGLFDSGDEVKMNTLGTINYDHWWVAIFENGGQNRYASNGWTSGLIPGNQFDLRQFWVDKTGTMFSEIPVSYTVQFAISSRCDTEWTNLDRWFAVCPTGTGCRIGETGALTIAPNPASTYFSLNGFHPSEASSYRLTLTDLNGRILKTFSQDIQRQFDVSDLSNGLYIVQIWENDARVFTTRLSVMR